MTEVEKRNRMRIEHQRNSHNLAVGGMTYCINLTYGPCWHQRELKVARGARMNHPSTKR